MCSALGRSFGRSYFTYQCSSPGAVDLADDGPASRQVRLAYPSGSLPTFRLASPPAFDLVAQSSHLCGRWFLTHWRFFAALSAGGVPHSALYNSAPCRPVVSPELLPQTDPSSFRKLCSPSQTWSNMKTKNTTISNRCSR